MKLFTIVKFFAFTALASAYILLAFMGYWYFYDNKTPPIYVNLMEYTSEVKHGGEFAAEWHVTRARKDCVFHYQWAIVDSRSNREYVIGEGLRSQKEKDSEIIIVSFNLPEYAVPGTYYYQSRLLYYCNPSNYMFSPIKVMSPKVYFEIIE